MWIGAGAAVLVVGVIALIALRSTMITVTPSSHTVVFDTISRFTAYPESQAADGALSYTIAVSDLEDSAVVPSNGTENVSERASGTVTVYNEYSAAPVRLLKNTRFATPDGLIFRAPATVVIPGKKGTTPGSVMITIIADQPGDTYNVGPVSRFTLPGLKSSPEYARVYARSTEAMTGGFEGTRPAVAPGALEAARAEIRTRMESKMRDAARVLASTTVTVFPDLMRITYSSLPPTAEAGGGLRIHEKAHAEVPVFPSALFAQTVAKAVGTDTGGAGVSLVGASALAASLNGTTSTIAFGKDPLNFTVAGTAKLVWDIDEKALTEALAGRDQTAFQNIVSGFPSIQEARARIEPFWKGTFPKNPSDIKVDVTPVSAQ